MNDLQKQFLEKFPDGLVDEPLKKYATFMIGGPADMFFKCVDLKDFPKLVEFAKSKEVPLFVMGCGSNILINDKGFRGLVVKLEANHVEIEGEKVIAEAGALISQVLKKTLEADLTGLENWLGLPGTVGGAVRGNAGCNDLETKDILENAVIYNPESGDISEKDAGYFDFDYRESKLKYNGEIVLKATFKLKKRVFSKEDQEKILDKYRDFRIYKQPFGATTGSFFKNPSKEKPAGLLIDQAGLKGEKLGNAQISEKHANFFINTGEASFKEMIELARMAKAEVKAKFGVELENEVLILGEMGPEKLD